jgi:ABC-type dipeptide/oligopeptide/nickel transport system ATPase component
MVTTLIIDGLSLEIEGNPVLRDISLSVNRGEMLAFAGASGSGKSMTALAVMGLLPPGAKITGGRILLNDEDLLTKRREELRRIRGEKIGMIFQEPLSSLNPVMSIGAQLMEPVKYHQGLSGRRAREVCLAALEEVKIADPRRVFDSYPHQLSGGMRQRVMIAMALSGDPAVLLADEPTTALDVTVQARVLEIIADLQKTRQLAVVFITHDIALAASVADRIAVIDQGRILEEGDVRRIITEPRNEYTARLIELAREREAWMSDTKR